MTSCVRVLCCSPLCLRPASRQRPSPRRKRRRLPIRRSRRRRTRCLPWRAGQPEPSKVKPRKRKADLSPLGCGSPFRRNASGADLTFATQPAASSQSECQIQAPLNHITCYGPLILTFAKEPAERDANVRIVPLACHCVGVVDDRGSAQVAHVPGDWYGVARATCTGLSQITRSPTSATLRVDELRLGGEFYQFLQQRLSLARPASR